MKKKLLALGLVIVIGMLSFLGCKSKRPEGAVDVYYINALSDGITAEAYVPEGSTKKELIAELLARLETEPDNVEYRKTIPTNVEVLETHLDKNTLSVYLNRDYKNLVGYNEVLVRSAIVKTLLQVEGVDSVSFFVSDEPLTNSSGTLVGSMTDETFIDDYNSDSQSLAATKMVLYFATADGQSLLKDEMDVYYNKNVAKERLIMEYLLKGPKDADALGVIPAGTKVLNVTVTDGVCYVNFDSTFLEQTSGVSSDVLLYAIVDSLTELDNINKVQILVNGASKMPDNAWNFKLGTSYERDTSLVHRDKAKEAALAD